MKFSTFVADLLMNKQFLRRDLKDAELQALSKTYNNLAKYLTSSTALTVSVMAGFGMGSAALAFSLIFAPLSLWVMPVPLVLALGAGICTQAGATGLARHVKDCGTRVDKILMDRAKVAARVVQAPAPAPTIDTSALREAFDKQYDSKGLTEDAKVQRPSLKTTAQTVK